MLFKIRPKYEMRDRGRKRIYFLVKIFVEGEVGKGERKGVNRFVER